jgi:acetyl esterase/lipase
MKRSFKISTASFVTCLLLIGSVSPVSPQDGKTQVDRNVVYGMVSGAALLMDVYRPPEPNGAGLIWVRGSGFQAPPPFTMWQLKEGPPFQFVLDAGYTVFTVNHRGAPMFRYPAAVEDVQRAVRFIRHNAHQFGIDPDRVGGWGASSGGTLVSLLATLDGEGDPDSPDPVDRESSKLQAAVAVAGAHDLMAFGSDLTRGVTATVSYMGNPPDPLFEKEYNEASPIHHVTPDDPPLLLIHGQADLTVSPTHSDRMYAVLQKQGVESELVRIPDGGHGVGRQIQENWRWLNRHLLSEPEAKDLESLVESHAIWIAAIQDARKGDLPAALAGFQEAQERDSRLAIPAGGWNGLCWQGGLWEQPEAVVHACDRAVELSPEDPSTRYGRGVVRALLGEHEKAVQDLGFFIDHVQDDGAKVQVKGFIEALRTGENPFTSELLRGWRG